MAGATALFAESYRLTGGGAAGAFGLGGGVVTIRSGNLWASLRTWSTVGLRVPIGMLCGVSVRKKFVFDGPGCGLGCRGLARVLVLGLGDHRRGCDRLGRVAGGLVHGHGHGQPLGTGRATAGIGDFVTKRYTVPDTPASLQVRVRGSRWDSRRCRSRAPEPPSSGSGVYAAGCPPLPSSDSWDSCCRTESSPARGPSSSSRRAARAPDRQRGKQRCGWTTCGERRGSTSKEEATAIRPTDTRKMPDDDLDHGEAALTPEQAAEPHRRDETHDLPLGISGPA